MEGNNPTETATDQVEANNVEPVEKPTELNQDKTTKSRSLNKSKSVESCTSSMNEDATESRKVTESSEDATESTEDGTESGEVSDSVFISVDNSSYIVITKDEVTDDREVG